MSINNATAQCIKAPAYNSGTKQSQKPRTGRFLNEQDRKALVKEQKQAKIQKAVQQRNLLLAKIVTTITDAVMIYMTLTGKIDDPFGILFVAALSVLLGYQMK